MDQIDRSSEVVPDGGDTDAVGDVVETFLSGEGDTHDLASHLDDLAWERPEEFEPYVGRLADRVTDEQKDIRLGVAYVFAALAEETPDLVISHVDEFAALLEDDRPFVLSATARGFGSLAEEYPERVREFLPQILSLLDVEFSWARGPQATIHKGALVTLVWLAMDSPDVLDEVDASRLEERLVEMHQSPMDEARSAATSVTANLTIERPDLVPAALEELPDRLDDDAPRVRRQAIYAFVNLGQHRPELVDSPAKMADRLESMAPDLEDELPHGALYRSTEALRSVDDQRS